MVKLFLFFLVVLIIFPQQLFAHTQTQVIEMTADGFSPDAVAVDVNSTIIFLNKDKVARWPASNVHPTHDLYPEFDPKRAIESGKSWTFKPKNVGTWKYHDHLLPHKRGTITVITEEGQDRRSGLEWIKNIWDKVFSKIQKIFFKKSVVDTAGFAKASAGKQIEIVKNVAQNNPQQAWSLVKETFKGQGGSSGNIHDLAHLSGSLLYKGLGFEGLGKCTQEFAFGCYHGFLDSAFKDNLDHLLDAEAGCLKLGPSGSGPVASCIHGIGHGIASFYSTNNLENSLSTCRKLTTGAEYCFDGVFMEYVRSAPDSFFIRSDPLYPCNSLENKFGYAYSFACGRNQPSLLMGRFQMGFDEVIGICLSSPSKEFKSACFDSLGFSLASSGDVERIITGCQKMGPPAGGNEYVSRCIKAAAGELVFQEVPGWSEKSKAVCAGFPQRETDCLEHVNRLIKEYGKKDINAYIREELGVCFENGGRDGCYKSAAQVLYDQFGLSKTLQALGANENYQEVYARCHEVTHYLSRFEFDKQKNIAAVYAQCDSTCHGGCYHGTLEAYLKENPKVDFAKICGEKQDYQKPIEFYECLHGLGHAGMFVTEMELKKSLALCDSLSDQAFKERCYSGVFMENSSSSTSSDHASIYIREGDPFYPCNILEEKYQPLCWQYQSSYFSIINNQDWAKVANLCLQIPEKYQDPCFKTIGTNQVGFTQDLSQMKTDCGLMPSGHFQNTCVAGVVSSLSYRFVGEAQKMIDFCSLVDPENQETCFKQMGTGFLDWDNNKDLAKKECSKIPNPQGLSWCMSVI